MSTVSPLIISGDSTFITIGDDTASNHITLSSGTYTVSNCVSLSSCMVHMGTSLPIFDIEYLDSPNSYMFFKSGENYFTVDGGAILRSLTEFEKEFYGF